MLKMDYDIGKFAGFKKIVILGPQRSGTTIMSKIIGSDLNIPVIDEAEFRVNDLNMLMDVTKDKDVFVVQGPGLMVWADQMPKDWLYVLSVRSIAEILMSEARIAWQQEGIEKQNLLVKFNCVPLMTTPSCIQKYIWWLTYMKPRLEHTVEITYASMQSHPLWIDKDGRKDFQYKQPELKD